MVGEADGFATFTVTLDAAAASTVTVNYTTADLSAYSGTNSDYIFGTGTLSFAAGVTTQTVKVAIVNDAVSEAVKSFVLALSNPSSNAVISTPKAVATIFDNDASPASLSAKANLSVHDVVVDEKDGTATFYVTLDRPTSNSFSVTYSTAGLSAVSGTDFSATSGTLNFAAGDTVKAVTVPITNDPLAQSSELFNLNLGTISGNSATVVQLADGVGTALIGHSGQTPVAQPAISMQNVMASEADGYVDFVVQLNAPSNSAVAVNYTTSDLSAYSGTNSDYIFTSGSLSFAPGVTTQTVRVAIVNDANAEPIKSFVLALSAASGAVIATPKAVATIVDNDASPASALARANISVHDVVVDEKDGTATFYVTLDRPVSDSFSVAYNTAGLSAVSGTDFTAASGSLTFGPGETVKSVIVNITNDALAESDELFNLVLGSVSGTSAGVVQVATAVGTALIGSNGQTPVAQPSISMQNVMASEADGYVDFVVQLNAPSNSAVSVNYTTSDLSAYSGTNSDYIFTSGSLSFAPGVTTQTVRVAIVNDANAEPIKSFVMALSSPSSNAVIATPKAVATIVDNDASPASALAKANISVHDVTVDKTDGTATFYVTLDRPVSDSFSVAYNTAGGTAVSGTDFTAASGSLTFAPNETVKAVTVNITGGTATTADALFNLNLGAVSGLSALVVQVADGVGTATIGHNAQVALAQPTISTHNVMVSEADGYADFVVQLNAPSNSAVSVNYTTSDLSAYSGTNSDYIFTSGSLSFAPGVTTQTVRVAVVNDASAEVTKSFLLALSSPSSNAVIGNTRAVATIVDNDASPASTLAKANISVQDVTVDEKDGTATFYVTLDRPVSDSFSVAYSTTGGTAISGTDFVPASGTLTFGPNETVKAVTVNINSDAAAFSNVNEYFNLNLGALGGTSAGLVQVADGSGAAVIGHSGEAAVANPTITVQNATVSEADAYVDFVVQLSAPSANAVSVNYSTSDGTAFSGTNSDYIFTSGSLSFAPGVTTQTVRVAIVNDAVAEVTQTFKLNLSSAVGGTVTTPIATATIIDDDSGTTVQSFGAQSLDKLSLSGTYASYVVNVIDPTQINIHGSSSLTLVNADRLIFSDRSFAYDMGTTQSAGETELLLGAVLGKALLATKMPLIGTAIGLFDQGYNMQQLAGALMRLDIWGLLANGGNAGTTNTQIASYLLRTVNGVAPDAPTLAAGVAALDSELGAAQGNFLWHLAASAANQTQVNLVGLATTGLEYVG